MEGAEIYARERVRRSLQHVLEEEMEEVLARWRYERREGVDASPGYRTGFGKPRWLSMMSGTITVRQSRVLGLAARFESWPLPLFKRRTEAVGRLLSCICTGWPTGTSIWSCGDRWGGRPGLSEVAEALVAGLEPE